MPYESDLPKVIDNTNGDNKESTKEEVGSALFNDSYGPSPKCGVDAKCAVDDGKEDLQVFRKRESDEDGISGKINDLVYRPGMDCGWDRIFKKDPSKEEIKDAQKKLDNTMSPLVSDDSRQIVQGITHSLLEGDTKGLTDALGPLSKDPERLRKFIEETNHDLKEVHAGVSLAVDSHGHVLVYKNHGKVAVDIDPRTGAAGERPIKVDFDGNVILEPGEILNADPSQALKSIGNSAVRNINEPFFHFDKVGREKQWPEKPWVEKLWPEKPVDPRKYWMDKREIQPLGPYYPNNMKPGVMYDKGLPQIELL